MPALNALRVGDVRARSVGVDVGRAQWIILAASSLLAASSVVLAGMVGFVGLIVPHIARRIVGSDARVLLPASALIGAALCIGADAICRWVVAPAELPIGALLAFIGVPAFLYIYLHGDTLGAQVAPDDRTARRNDCASAAARCSNASTHTFHPASS